MATTQPSNQPSVKKGYAPKTTSKIAKVTSRVARIHSRGAPRVTSKAAVRYRKGYTAHLNALLANKQPKAVQQVASTPQTGTLSNTGDKQSSSDSTTNKGSSTNTAAVTNKNSQTMQPDKSSAASSANKAANSLMFSTTPKNGKQHLSTATSDVVKQAKPSWNVQSKSPSAPSPDNTPDAADSATKQDQAHATDANNPSAQKAPRKTLTPDELMVQQLVNRLNPKRKTAAASIAMSASKAANSAAAR